MIDGLISGKLHGTALERTSKAGKPFTTAKLKAATHEGESLFINLLAFDATAQAALLALGDGDAVAVAVAGSIKPTAWQDKDGNTRTGLDVIAAQAAIRSGYSRTPPPPSATRTSKNLRYSWPCSMLGRPKDEAWQAMAPGGHTGHAGDGLDDGDPLDF